MNEDLKGVEINSGPLAGKRITVVETPDGKQLPPFIENSECAALMDEPARVGAMISGIPDADTS